MTKKINAYCLYCKSNVDGNLISDTVTESKKHLLVGACEVCGHEIKRITS
jgi:hypothetical protein